MPQYLSPGVYVEEQDSGPEPIEGVSTSVTAFVGVTQCGPWDTLPPVLVTSFPEFTRIFGGYFTPNFSNLPTNPPPLNLLPHAVAGFFNNGGQLLYIKRVANGLPNQSPTPAGVYPPATATAASSLQNSAATPHLITQLATTAYQNSTSVQLLSLRGIQKASTLTLTQVKNGLTTVASGLALASYNDLSGVVTLTAALTSTFEAGYTTVTVAGGAFTPVNNSSHFALTAANPGAWGNSVQVQIRPSSRALAQVQSLGDSVPGTHDTVLLNSSANFYAGAIVEFNLGTTKVYAKIKAVVGNSIQVTPAFASTTSLQPNGSGATPPPTTARTCEFDILSSYNTVNESFRGLTLDDTTPYYYATTILNGSTLLTVPAVTAPPPPYPRDDTTTDPSTMPMAVDGLNVDLLGGTDGGYPSANDFIGMDGGPGNRTGIAALIDVDEISLIAAPGITDQATQGALITQCETLLYRFAILDPAPNATGGTPALTDVQNQRLQFDTKYGAIYYPRLVVDDPLTGNNLTVPPSGHMAGIYAQTDNTRGVWKAPANVVINGILNLEVKLSKGDQDILNPEPNNINALRDFTSQGRGRRVYGARCMTSDAEWMYVNVRRLFIFLEASLDAGTQWAVFEPNDEQLWDRLTQSVESFLTTIWRQGGLMGDTAEDAFYVKCGYDTMSLDDIENGRLILQVGVAPVFPAEFVIIRIGQWQGGSSVTEL